MHLAPGTAVPIWRKIRRGSRLFNQRDEFHRRKLVPAWKWVRGFLLRRRDNSLIPDRRALFVRLVESDVRACEFPACVYRECIQFARRDACTSPRNPRGTFLRARAVGAEEASLLIVRLSMACLRNALLRADRNITCGRRNRRALRGWEEEKKDPSVGPGY